MINAEKWVEYKNSGYYISNYGAIKKKKKNGRYRFLSDNSLDRYGYPKTMLTINGKRNYSSIHRLVAELFIPNPLNLPQVNHKNGNKQDNRASNLEWCTAVENMRHAYNTLQQGGKKRQGVIAISKDWTKVLRYPSISAASRAHKADPKEIRRSAESWEKNIPHISAKGYYWLKYTDTE